VGSRLKYLTFFAATLSSSRLVSSSLFPFLLLLKDAGFKVAILCTRRNTFKCTDVISSHQILDWSLCSYYEEETRPIKEIQTFVWNGLVLFGWE